MFARHCTMGDLEKALTIINKKYARNIRFYDTFNKGRAIHFRLKVHDSKGPGAARSAIGNRTGSGCWHVHGDFFDSLLKVSPEAVIRTAKAKIDRHGGNWEDWN